MLNTLLAQVKRTAPSAAKPPPHKQNHLVNKVCPMRILIALVVLASSIAGCAVYTPSGSVVIDPAGRHDSGGEKFCPPGQAKKGNC